MRESLVSEVGASMVALCGPAAWVGVATVPESPVPEVGAAVAMVCGATWVGTATVTKVDTNVGHSALQAEIQVVLLSG